jgi:hypothetical protein
MEEAEVRMTTRPIDVAKVSAVLQALLKGSGKPVVIADLQSGEALVGFRGGGEFVTPPGRR